MKAISLIALAVLAGCSTLDYSREMPDGELVELQITAFANDTSIDKLRYQANADGSRSFGSEGYDADRIDAFEAAANAMVEAAKAITAIAD